MSLMHGYTIVGNNYRHKESQKWFKVVGWCRIKVDGYGWIEHVMYHVHNGNPLALYGKCYTEFKESFENVESVE